MAKKKKGSKSSKASSRKSKPASKPKATQEKAPVEVGLRIQGTRVLTPGDKAKPGRRGASGYLPLAHIKVISGFNPRVSVGDVSELAKSIKKNGLLNALTVRPSKDGKTFSLVAGERRYVALKSLGKPFTDSVAVNIRTDLAKDDLAARAVSIAENSDDGRTNLSPVEVGRVATELLKKKWSVARIASETGLHSKKVQRCIDLVSAPKDVLAKVEKGELGMVAALEASALPAETREKILSEAGPGATVDSIRKVRKQLEREARAEAVAKGEDRSKTKAGKRREKGVTAWRSAREKQAKLRELCHDFSTAEDADVQTGGWHELRGVIASLLWDRGDLDSPILPDADPKNDEDPKGARKANAVFDSIVKAEAELVEQPDEAVGAEA